MNTFWRCSINHALAILCIKEITSLLKLDEQSSDNFVNVHSKEYHNKVKEFMDRHEVQ